MDIVLPLLLLQGALPPIPPGLTPYPALPGLRLELCREPPRRDGQTSLIGIISNGSKEDYAIWHCPYANTRWFAQAFDGGPILAEKDWAKDFPGPYRDSNFPVAVSPGRSSRFAYGPPKWIESLPAGRYKVWVLYREREWPTVIHTVSPNPRVKRAEGKPWTSPAMQLVSNTVTIEVK